MQGEHDLFASGFALGTLTRALSLHEKPGEYHEAQNHRGGPAEPRTGDPRTPPGLTRLLACDVGEDTGGEITGRLFAAAKSIAAGEGLGKGFRLVVNTGPDGGQTVDHLHIHLLGGRFMTWPPG